MANCPIFRRSDTKWIRGIMAKGSWSDSTTWLSTSSPPVARSPNQKIVAAAGTTASSRVIIRRSQGRIRMSR